MAVYKDKRFYFNKCDISVSDYIVNPIKKVSEFTYFLTAYPASKVVQCPSVNFLPFFLILCGTQICEAEVQLPALCHVVLGHAWYLQ